MARRTTFTVENDLIWKLLIIVGLEPRFVNKGGVFRIVVLDVAGTIGLYYLEVGIGHGGLIRVHWRSSTPFDVAQCKEECIKTNKSILQGVYLVCGTQVLETISHDRARGPTPETS